MNRFMMIVNIGVS